MARSKKSAGPRTPAGKPPKKAAAAKASGKPPKKAAAVKASGKPSGAVELPASALTGGPVTLEQVRAMVKRPAPRAGRALAAAMAAGVVTDENGPSPAPIADEQIKVDEEVAKEHQRRIEEYATMMTIMKTRGVEGLQALAAPAAAPKGPKRAALAAAGAGQPLQIFAEGDSWFDYPVPLFGGGVVPRLARRLGIPILNLAKAGDEVRNMLGVEERAIIQKQLHDGSPAGGRWDAMLFSGGGNDIVGNPMVLWVNDFNQTVAPETLINAPRFQTALDLVRAGYEDLIGLRDKFSPGTHLFFHGYDFAIPDGRGICRMGPWLKPTFDTRNFRTRPPAERVVKAMLTQFAAMLRTLASANPKVTYIETQGTLAPVTASWHNELHPSGVGFDSIAGVFHASIRSLFPGRVL